MSATQSHPNADYRDAKLNQGGGIRLTSASLIIRTRLAFMAAADELGLVLLPASGVAVHTIPTLVSSLRWSRPAAT